MAPTKKIHKCLMCKLSTEDSTCIQCDICKLWVHNGCAGLSEEDISNFNKLPVASFICSVCKSNLHSGDSRGGISNLGRKLDALCEKLNTFIVKSNDDNNKISSKLDMAVADIKGELAVSVNNLKSEIEDCKDLTRKVEVSANNRFDLIEMENNTLYKRLYANDIILHGLPDCLKDLPFAVTNLAKFYNINITSHDINQAVYVNKKKSVLVKFNSFSLRNAIMAAYYKNLRASPLKASDFVTDVPADLLDHRIYLNDHHSPAVSEIYSTCLKLRKKGLIKRFKLLNTVKPMATIMMLNDEEVKLDSKGCVGLLNNSNAADI